MSDFDPIFGTVKTHKPNERPYSIARESIPYATGNMPGWWTSDHLNELRHFTDWNYVAVHALGKQVMQATVCVYDNLRTKGYTAPDSPDLQRKHNPKHPIAKLLKRPNRKTSRGQFLYQIALQIGLTGGFAIWEVPSLIRGIPAELWVIPRGWLWFWPPTPEFPDGVYRVTPAIAPQWGSYQNNFAASFLVDAREMIVDGWSDPQYLGEFRSPLAACSQLIDISEQTDIATLARFKNEVKPGLLFSVDPRTPMTEAMIAKLYEQLEQYKAGANNAGKSMVAQGVTAQKLGGSDELDYTNGRDQNRKNVFGIQGVAPLVAGFIDGAGGYSAAAVTVKTTSEMTVQPMLNLIGDAFTHRWSEAFGDDFQVELSAKSYDDPTLELQRADKLMAGMDKQAVTINEWRASMKLPPIEGGDEMKQPEQPQMPGMPGMGGMMPGGDEQGQQPPAEGDEQQDDPMAEFDSSDFDLADDLGDDDESGTKNPLMQAASGNRMAKAFLNGKH